MKKLKSKLRKWLGIQQNENSINILNRLYSDLTSIGVDVHFKTPHMILIFSKLNGGQIRHIEADFSTIQELNDLTRQLEEMYRPKYRFYDLPAGIDRRIFER